MKLFEFFKKIFGYSQAAPEFGCGGSKHDSRGSGAHHIDVSANGIHVDGVQLPEFTVTAFKGVFGQPRIVEPSSKEPDDRGIISSSLVIWDTSGVMAYTKDGQTVEEFSVRLSEDPEWESLVNFSFAERRPRYVYSGKFTISSKPLMDAIPEKKLRSIYLFCEIRSGSWLSTLFLSKATSGPIERMDFGVRLSKIDTDEIADHVRSAPSPFREVSISYEPPRVSTGKWALSNAMNDGIALKSFAFKLAIVQQLMYCENVLLPKFDVYDFSADYAGREIKPDEYYFEMIPEVRNWFLSLPIPADLAAQIEELYLDGGNDIYLQLVPQWDGEDNLFVVQQLTANELAYFPKLKRVTDTGGFLSDRARKALTGHGIEVSD